MGQTNILRNKFYINYEKSKQVYQSISNRLEVQQCYKNVYYVMTDIKFIDQIDVWKVVYCYAHEDSNLYFRHCAILDEDNRIIDPTIFTSSFYESYSHREYIVFGILTYREFLDCIASNDNKPALLDYYKKLERELLVESRQAGLVFAR